MWYPLIEVCFEGRSFGGWLCPAHCTLPCLPAARKKVDLSSLSQDKQAGAMTAQFFLGLTNASTKADKMADNLVLYCPILYR